MTLHHRPQASPRFSRLLLAFFGVAVFLSLAPSARAQYEVGDPGPAPAATVQSYTLEDCIQSGLANQPALRAAQASLAGAQVQAEALENLRIAGLVSHELPIRRKQAALGVVIASGEVTKTEWDTVYAVTRNYFSAVYAHQQVTVIRKMIDNLIEKREFAVNAEKADPLKVNKADIDRLGVYTVLAKMKLIEAEQGVERAKAALREAMGMEQCTPLWLTYAELPAPQADLCKEQLIQLALARRGEIIRASTAAQVTCLEVSAQGANNHMEVRTFAAAGDIHAVPVPQGDSNGQYRPWAVGIEMPTILVGHRDDRVRRAQEYHAKAVAVAEKAQQLIALEAVEGFLKWQEAFKQIEIMANTPKSTASLLKQAVAKFELDPKTAENLINTQVLSAQVLASYNEALYKHALALAALERITAGGFVPAYRKMALPLNHP